MEKDEAATAIRYYSSQLEDFSQVERYLASNVNGQEQKLTAISISQNASIRQNVSIGSNHRAFAAKGDAQGLELLNIYKSKFGWQDVLRHGVIDSEEKKLAFKALVEMSWEENGQKEITLLSESLLSPGFFPGEKKMASRQHAFIQELNEELAGKVKIIHLNLPFNRDARGSDELPIRALTGLPFANSEKISKEEYNQSAYQELKELATNQPDVVSMIEALEAVVKNFDELSKQLDEAAAGKTAEEWIEQVKEWKGNREDLSIANEIRNASLVNLLQVGFPITRLSTGLGGFKFNHNHVLNHAIPYTAKIAGKDIILKNTDGSVSREGLELLRGLSEYRKS